MEFQDFNLEEARKVAQTNMIDGVKSTSRVFMAEIDRLTAELAAANKPYTIKPDVDVAWTKCAFMGPVPDGHPTWQAWALSREYIGVRVTRIDHPDQYRPYVAPQYADYNVSTLTRERDEAQTALAELVEAGRKSTEALIKERDETRQQAECSNLRTALNIARLAFSELDAYLAFESDGWKIADEAVTEIDAALTRPALEADHEQKHG